MPYRITITTPLLEWSRYKLAENERAILQILAQEGAPNCEWKVEEVGVEAVPQKPALVLHCAPCGVEWRPEFFTPCPKCSQRGTVARGPLPTVAAAAPALFTKKSKYVPTGRPRGRPRKNPVTT